MASGSNYLTTYYAKRIIGDSAAATASQALLQSGTGITDDTWIFHRTNRTSVYGIHYDYDNSSNGTKDKLELYGGYQVSSTDTPTAWVRLDTGDVYILGKVGIGYDPNTSGNSYKLYVNGTSYFTNTAYFGNGTTYYISADGSQYTGSAAKWTNARTLTIGGTGKSVDGSANVSWSMDEIMGSSDSNKFYRGDKTWSNTIVGSFNASSSGSNRANINMVTVADQPNDFYLGNNNANKWSITSRASNESYNLNVYSTASGISYCTRWEYSTGKFYMLHGAEVSGGKLTISANILPHIQLSRSDAGEVSIYWTNNTSGWAAGINPWSVGAGQFAIGQYSGTGSSHWRLRIDNNGYVYTSSYLNLGAGNENNASSPPRVLGFNGSDNFVRSYQTAYLNVNSATYASSYLANRGSVSGSSHAEALKAYFNSYKSSEPRNSLVAHYSSAYGNGSLCMGYFLSGYDSGPYGGFFVCHYNDPHYVGISGGTYTQQHILTSTNYTSYTVTKTGSGASGSWGISITGNAATATRINGNLAQATSNDNRNIWVSSTTGADGIPNYVTTFTMNPSTKTLHIPSGGRIDANGGALYLGNSNNASWVYVQDMASQSGIDKWKITQTGAATFVGSVTAGSFVGAHTDMGGTRRDMQIRYGSQNVSYGSTTTISFSPAFSNACLMVVPFCVQLGFGAYDCISVNNWSKSSFQVYNYNSSSVTMTVGYIAIGY